MGKKQSRHGLTERREVRLDVELDRLLREAAKREDTSESRIIRRALRAFFDANVPLAELVERRSS